MLELVARHLRSIDKPKLEVLEASDGDEAWKLAQERLPDLVVLDVMMPGMSGWEVCRKIRHDPSLACTRGVNVMLDASIGESLNETTSPLFGADEYVDKPFDFQSLDQKIKNVLASRAAQRESVPRPIGNGVGGPAALRRQRAQVARGQRRPSSARAVKNSAGTKRRRPLRRPRRKEKSSWLRRKVPRRQRRPRRRLPRRRRRSSRRRRFSLRSFA